MDGGNWGAGEFPRVAAGVGKATGSEAQVVSGGPEVTGEGGTKGSGAAGPDRGRVCCGVEYACGGKDCMGVALGEEKELVVARGARVEDGVVVADPTGLGGGVLGGVISIPLSSIIVQHWHMGEIQVCVTYAGDPRHFESLYRVKE